MNAIEPVTFWAGGKQYTVTERTPADEMPPKVCEHMKKHGAVAWVTGRRGKGKGGHWFGWEYATTGYSVIGTV